jgi:hypothetical protein
MGGLQKKKSIRNYRVLVFIIGHFLAATLFHATWLIQ